MRTLCYQKKKKNHSRSQETKACQSSVSCALSLGVEGGDAGEKGEPVWTRQGLLLTPGASQQGGHLPCRWGSWMGKGCLQSLVGPEVGGEDGAA